METPVIESRRSRPKSFLPKPINEGKRSMSVDGRSSFGWHRGSLQSVADKNQGSARSIRRSRSLVRVTSTPITAKGNALLPSSAYRTLSADRSRQKSPSERINRQIIRKEVRPINDKKWVSSQSMRVQEFIQKTPELCHLASKGQLKSMSVTTFIAVLNYLIEPIIGKKQALNSANYIDEMLLFVKKFYYPGTITKSALKTPNTSHSWSSALALITWLMDLGFGDEPILTSTQKRTEELLFQMYFSWNANDQESYDQYMVEFANVMLEDSGFKEFNVEEEKVQQAEIKKLQEENASLKERCEAIKMEVDSYKNLIKEFYERDNLRDDQQTVISELQQNIMELETTRDTLLRKRSDLLESHKINNISHESKVQLEKEIRSMRTELTQTTEFSDHLSKELFENRMKFCEFKKITDAKAVEFNKTKFFLVSQVTSMGMNTDESYDLLGNDEHILTDLDKIKEIILQAIEERKKVCQDKEDEINNLTQIEVELANKRQAVQNEIEIIEEEIKKLNQNYERENILLQQEKRIILEEMEKKNGYISRKAFLETELEKRQKVAKQMQDSIRNYMADCKTQLEAKRKEFDERALAVANGYKNTLTKLQELSKKKTDFLLNYEAKKKELLEYAESIED